MSGKGDDGINVESVFKNRTFTWKREYGTPGRCQSSCFRYRRRGWIYRGGAGKKRCRPLERVDDDKVCLTNINRQIIATRSTVGKYKVDVAKDRILDINPHAVVHTYKTFYMPNTADQFDFSQYDYVVDAIDTVTGKIQLVEQANACGVPSYQFHGSRR